jgi:hypothetical protein
MISELIQVNRTSIYWLLKLGLLLHPYQHRVTFKGLLLLLLHHFLLWLHEKFLEFWIKLIVPELILGVLTDFCTFTQVFRGALANFLIYFYVLMLKDLSKTERWFSKWIWVPCWKHRDLINGCWLGCWNYSWDSCWNSIIKIRTDTLIEKMLPRALFGCKCSIWVFKPLPVAFIIVYVFILKPGFSFGTC